VLGNCIVAFSLEFGMASDRYLNDEISVEMSLSLKFKLGSIVDPPGKFYLLLRFYRFHSLARALGARWADDGSIPVAFLALHAHHHDSLLEGHEACPLAAVALLGFGAGFGPAAFAGPAGISTAILDGLVYKNYTFEMPLTASVNSSSTLVTMF